MKKYVLGICLVLIIASVFSACSMELESKAAAQEMLAELSSGNVENAVALLHPSIAAQLEDPEQQLRQIVELLDGRTVIELKQTYNYIGFKVNAQFAGKEEQGIFDVTLNDGTVCQLQTVYFSGSSKGFASFFLSFPEGIPEEGDPIDL